MPIYALDELTPDLPASGEYWVAPDAQVIGKVRIGRDVGIWFGAVIRGDNDWIEIGEGTNIQDGAIIHTDEGFRLTIGRGCVIGHRAMLHGCIIGDNALIGMGATLLNGARIGDNSVVGANALVTEGKSFPESSLIIGSPARAIRTLDETAMAGIREAAEHYSRRWRRFARGLKRID